MRGHCYSLLGGESEAEEAAQEIFIKAYRYLGKFRGDSSFSTWLYHITSNHCLDLLRKRKRRPTVSWDALVEQEGERMHRLLDHKTLPDSSLENRDLVEKILSTLSPDQRNLLTLRESQELSYEEIAKILGCTINAVKSRLSRARKALQDQLQHFLSPSNVNISKEKEKVR